MRTESALRTLTDFEGAWTLDREIAHADGTVARFEGQAVWHPDAEGLIYHETGLLRMPGGAVMQAERRYLWRDKLRVFFADDRFFHQVPPRGGTARHQCDPDSYEVCYDFEDWPVFSTAWRVRGPRKDYRMTSHYHRC